MPELEHLAQPILGPADVQPTSAELRVIGVFNPGACLFGDQTLLLLRVAEAPIAEPDWVRVAVADQHGDSPRAKVLSWRRDQLTQCDDSDPRHLQLDGQRYLSSLSHLRLARSDDGIHFTVDPQPLLFPHGAADAYGIEDVRVSRIGDRYYLAYTAVSADGFDVALASTSDFQHFEAHGVILPPENKDACLFPAPSSDGPFRLLHRPVVSFLGKPSIWYAESPDGVHWGKHRCLLRPADLGWQKIGAGPEPLRTDAGWLLLYHACDNDNRYTLHLALLDRDHPSRIIAHSSRPLLVPTADWERHGFVDDVVFCNGWVRHPGDRVDIYYGAADRCIGLLRSSIADLLALLDNDQAPKDPPTQPPSC